MLRTPENCPSPLKDIIQHLDFSIFPESFLNEAQSVYPFQILNVWHQLHEMSLQDKLPKNGRKFRVLSIGSGLGLEVTAIIAFCKTQNITPEFFLVDTKQQALDFALRMYKSDKNIHAVCCDGGSPEIMERNGVSGEFDMVVFRHPPMLEYKPQREFANNAFLKTIPHFVSDHGLVLVSCYSPFEMQLVKGFYKSDGLKPETSALVNIPFNDLRREHQISFSSPNSRNSLSPESYNIIVTFSKTLWQNRLGYLLRLAAAHGDYQSFDNIQLLTPFCVVSLLNLKNIDFINSAGSGTLKTALHQACGFSDKNKTDNYFAIITALLSKGADPKLEDSFAKTPLYYFELKAPKNHPKYKETLLALGGMMKNETDDQIKLQSATNKPK